MNTQYFGTFSTRAFELRAYRELDEEAKDRMVPVVTLRHVDRATSLLTALDAVLAASGPREVIVDFDPMPLQVTSAEEAAENRRLKAQRERREATELSPGMLARHAVLRDEKTKYNAALSTLTSNTLESGVRWIELTEKLPGVRPIVRLTTSESIVAQVSRADEIGKSLAFRCTSGSVAEIALVCQGIRALSDPSSALLLVESEHSRGETGATVQRLESTFRHFQRSLGSVFTEISKVVVANSFPGGSLKNQPRLLETEELRVHRTIANTWNVAYGDHCSIPPRSGQDRGRGFFPHVDIATPTHWRFDLVERNRDKNGYIEAASSVMETPEWREREHCWGTRVIEHVSNGHLIYDDVKLTVPGPWIGVRVNQHMTQRAKNGPVDRPR